MRAHLRSIAVVPVLAIVALCGFGCSHTTQPRAPQNTGNEAQNSDMNTLRAVGGGPSATDPNGETTAPNGGTASTTTAPKGTDTTPPIGPGKPKSANPGAEINKSPSDVIGGSTSGATDHP